MNHQESEADIQAEHDIPEEYAALRGEPDQGVAQNSIILEPEWGQIREWVKHVYRTDPKYARSVNNTLNREKVILEVDDIPMEIRQAFQEFPEHGHWHDLADLAVGGGLRLNSRLADECATVWAREVLGKDVDADPIQ